MEVPAWAGFVSWAADAVDGRLGHVLCGSGLPDWVWLVPVGWPRRDADGVLDNSLGRLVHEAFTRLLFLDMDQATLRCVVPVSRQLADSLHSDVPDAV